MVILIFMIAASLVVALLFLLGFVWAEKSGQYEDLEGPSIRLLLDENQQSYIKNHESIESKGTKN